MKTNGYIKVTMGPSRQKKEEDLTLKNIFLCIVACLLIFGLFAVVGHVAVCGFEKVLRYTPTKAYTIDLFTGK